MKPLWRWALFCAALEATRYLRWKWLSDTWAWCILPGWVCTDEEAQACRDRGNEPWNW